MNQIPYQDNLIIQTKPGCYHFQSSYEIAINDCLVRGVISRDNRQLIHLDITGTEAHQTISEFVTEIAAKVGLIRDIRIGNLALEFTPELNNGNVFRKHRTQHADVTIEWRSFTINGQNIQLDLSLTGITFNNESESTSTSSTASEPDPKSRAQAHAQAVQDLIKGTSVKTIEPTLVPKLYSMEEKINISIDMGV